NPIPLARLAKPFDDPDWIYEIKHDGFRAFAVIERGHCRFICRNKFKLYGLRDLAEALVHEVNAETAILDGELAVPDHLGRTVFDRPMCKLTIVRRETHHSRFKPWSISYQPHSDNGAAFQPAYLCLCASSSPSQELRGFAQGAHTRRVHLVHISRIFCSRKLYILWSAFLTIASPS